MDSNLYDPYLKTHIVEPFMYFDQNRRTTKSPTFDYAIKFS